MTTVPDASSPARALPSLAAARPRRRWLRTAVLAALGFLILVILAYTMVRGATYSNDFKNPYRVARVFWRTGQLDIRSEPRYPPTVRVLLAPLAALPIAGAAALWALASMGAIASLPRLFTRLAGVPPRSQALGWLAILPFLIDAFVLGQSDPINLFLVTAGLLVARRGRSALGASLIGLAGMIKVLPVIFWGVLVARRRIRGALAGAALTAVAGVGLLTGFAGWSAGLSAIVEWYAGVRDAEGPWGLVVEHNSLRENNESLPVVLARTIGATDPDLSRNAVSLARLPLRAVWGLWLAMLAVMAVTWLACAARARRVPADRAWLGMFALTAGLMLAATHIAWPHYFLWLLPAALFLTTRPRVLVAVAAIGQLGMMVAVLRGVGCHAWLALALFALVAHDLLAARAEEAIPGPRRR